MEKNYVITLTFAFKNKVILANTTLIVPNLILPARLRNVQRPHSIFESDFLLTLENLIIYVLVQLVYRFTVNRFIEIYMDELETGMNEIAPLMP